MSKLLVVRAVVTKIHDRDGDDIARSYNLADRIVEKEETFVQQVRFYHDYAEEDWAVEGHATRIGENIGRYIQEVWFAKEEAEEKEPSPNWEV